MKYKAKVDTLLKKEPIQGESLPNNEKVTVDAGKVYTINEILESDGLHRQVELAYEAGTWWIFLPHWETNIESGEVRAVFNLQQANVSNLIYGSLTFYRNDDEILNVRASSGLPGYQYSGAHTVQGKGCIPPDKDWKINTAGYFLETPGIEGKFYHITPDPDPDTERSEFGLHRDANIKEFPGSAGCIVVKTSDFRNKIQPLLDDLTSTQTSVPLKVVYTVLA